MKRIWLLLIVAGILATAAPAFPRPPFSAQPQIARQAPEPSFYQSFLVTISQCQQHLKQRMADLIRKTRRDGDPGPLLTLLALAFLYGAIHAAGPGHGKAVATSYVLSHRASLRGGVLFGIGVAMLHGGSGILSVIGLRYLLQQSVSRTLVSVTQVTELVSFALIALLGLGILVKNGCELFFRRAPEHPEAAPAPPRRQPLLWATAVGIIPCPAVVMTMLFCLSMGALVLGLLLTLCISLGMALTISLVVCAVVAGKSGFLQRIPPKIAAALETGVGMASGAAIAIFGVVLLLAAVHRT
ncbi:MAG: hypothetical protein JXB25_01485 [Deltaproteobacteria bacterium]|nr:hypothetical protein [Deltaproteobacteria bacterium]